MPKGDPNREVIIVPTPSATIDSVTGYASPGDVLGLGLGLRGARSGVLVPVLCRYWLYRSYGAAEPPVCFFITSSFSLVAPYENYIGVEIFLSVAEVRRVRQQASKNSDNVSRA